jgi:hypothetical protein
VPPTPSAQKPQQPAGSLSTPPVAPSAPTYTPPVAPVYTPPSSVLPTVSAQPVVQPSQMLKAHLSTEPIGVGSGPWGKLILSNGKEIILSGERVLVGRYDHDLGGVQPEVDLGASEGADTVSRGHATIEHIGSTYQLTDLHSTNFSRINSKRVDPNVPTPINDGDTLQFGKVTSTFKKV